MSHPLELRIVSPQSKTEWEQYFDLRWRVLREPWDQPRGSERDADEDSAVHRMVVDAGGEPLAVGRLQQVDGKTGRIRYMATAAGWQRKGLGSLLLKELEGVASSMGLTELFLNAREPMLGFYRRNGYLTRDRAEAVFSIPHWRMEKTL